jgi:hypothetical protein
MKIERILYGMQTSDGKILMLKTPGLSSLLASKSVEYIRNLKPEDTRKRLWFRTEQTVVYPIIISVTDKDPRHGGRTWVQTQAFATDINGFMDYVQAGKNPFEAFESLVASEYERFPDSFMAVTV